MNYKTEILKGLYKRGIINDEIYEKCSKPHITDLPYDLRINDIDKLTERLDVIDENIKKLDKDIKDLEEWNNTLEDNIKDSLDESLNDIDNLKRVFNADVLDDADKTSETYSDYENVKELYNNVVNLYNQISNQLNSFINNNGVVENGLLERYEDACLDFSENLGEVYNLEDILDISSNPLMFDERMYVYDGDDLDIEGTNIRGYYNLHNSNSIDIQNNQRIIDDLINESLRTQERINSLMES